MASAPEPTCAEFLTRVTSMSYGAFAAAGAPDPESIRSGAYVGGGHLLFVAR